MFTIILHISKLTQHTIKSIGFFGFFTVNDGLMENLKAISVLIMRQMDIINDLLYYKWNFYCMSYDYSNSYPIPFKKAHKIKYFSLEVSHFPRQTSFISSKLSKEDA